MHKILVFHTRTYKRYTVYGRNELSELIDIPEEQLPPPGGDVDRFFRMSVSTYYQNIDAVGEMVKGYFPTLSVVPA